MTRITLAILVACLIAIPASACAQTGMNLAWNNCITQSTAASNVSYACDGSRTGVPYKLVFSFYSPANLTAFVGLDAAFDIQTEEPTLPNWWHLASGECRSQAIAFPGSLLGIGTGATGACQNPWAGTQTGGGYRWFTDSDGDSATPGRARLRVAFARDAGYPVSLISNQQYVGGVILLDPYGDIADEENVACDGCSTSVCIVLSSITLTQNSGASGGDANMITAAAVRRHVTWQGGLSGGCQAAIPLKNTWGSIRAVYH